MSDWITYNNSEKRKYSWYVVVAILFFSLGYVLNDCKRNPSPVTPKVVVEHTTDTFYRIDTFTIIEKIPTGTYVDTTIVYDTIKYGNKYYHLTFEKDSLYKINTYGGYVDSLQVKVYQKEITIKDSVKITTIETLLKKNNGLYLDMGLGYKMSKEFLPEIGLSYNFNKFRIGVGTAYLLGNNFKEGWIIKMNVGFKLTK